MNDINDLYKSPKANLATEAPADAGPQLATRGNRLMAAIVDGIISLLVSVPLLFYFDFWELAKQGQEAPMSIMLTIGISGMVFFVLIHGYLLKNYGQTIGKKMANIYIVDLDNNVPQFGKLISLRYLPMWIVNMIPMINSVLPLVDILFIFRKDRRCIHDLIAGTKVITKSV